MELKHAAKDVKKSNENSSDNDDCNSWTDDDHDTNNLSFDPEDYDTVSDDMSIDQKGNLYKGPYYKGTKAQNIKHERRMGRDRRKKEKKKKKTKKISTTPAAKRVLHFSSDPEDGKPAAKQTPKRNQKPSLTLSSSNKSSNLKKPSQNTKEGKHCGDPNHKWHNHHNCKPSIHVFSDARHDCPGKCVLSDNSHGHTGGLWTRNLYAEAVKHWVRLRMNLCVDQEVEPFFAAIIMTMMTKTCETLLLVCK